MRRVLICPKCHQSYEVDCTDHQFETGNYKKYCSRKCANSRTFSEETILKKRESALNYLKEHPYHTKRFYKTYNCKYCGKSFNIKTLRDTGGINYCSNECRDKWLKEVAYPKCGGYRKGSGQGKHGWYNGIYCDSSYELAFVIYNVDHNIPIERCKKSYEYTVNGKNHRYYPDFIINHKTIVEIKGYYTDLVDVKIKSVDEPVTLLYKRDIQHCIDYVCDTYKVSERQIYTLYQNAGIH